MAMTVLDLESTASTASAPDLYSAEEYLSTARNFSEPKKAFRVSIIMLDNNIIRILCVYGLNFNVCLHV